MPRKTRHRDVSEIKTARALVLGDGLNFRHNEFDDARGDDAAALVVEQHVMVARGMVLWACDL